VNILCLFLKYALHIWILVQCLSERSFWNLKSKLHSALHLWRHVVVNVEHFRGARQNYDVMNKLPKVGVAYFRDSNLQPRHSDALAIVPQRHLCGTWRRDDDYQRWMVRSFLVWLHCSISSAQESLSHILYALVTCIITLLRSSLLCLYILRLKPCTHILMSHVLNRKMK